MPLPTLSGLKARWRRKRALSDRPVRRALAETPIQHRRLFVPMLLGWAGGTALTRQAVAQPVPNGRLPGPIPTLLGGTGSASGSADALTVTFPDGTKPALPDALNAKAALQWGQILSLTLGVSATPSQALQNTRIINAVIAAAISAGLTEVWLPAGVIVVAKDPLLNPFTDPYTLGPPCAILIKGASRLTVRGLSTKVLTYCTDRSNYCATVLATYCGLVEFEGVEFDWVNLPFTQGVITAVSPGAYVEMLLDWAPTWGDAQMGLVLGGDDLDVLSFFVASNSVTAPGFALTQQSGRTYRLNIGSLPAAGGTVNLADAVVGARVVLAHNGEYGHAIASFFNDELSIADDIAIRAAAGSGVRAIGTRRINAPNITIAPAAGSGRLVSVHGDGVHGCGAGLDSRVGGLFERTLDDGVNLYPYVTALYGWDSARQVRFGTYFPWTPPRAGDQYAFVSDDNTILLTFRAVAVNTTGGNTAVTTDTDIPSSYVNKRIAYLTTGKRVTVAGLRGGHIRGCGARIKAVEPVAYDFDLYGCTDPVLFVGPHQASEWGPQKILTFSDIRATECNFWTTQNNGPAVIQITAFGPDGVTPSPAGAIGKVILNDPLIRRTKNGAVFVSGASSVVVNGLVTEEIGSVPSSILGLAGGYAVGLINTGAAKIYGARGPGFVAALNVASLVMRGCPELTPPMMGPMSVTALDAGQWISFTPTLQSGSTITPTATDCKYRRSENGTIEVRFFLDFGSSNYGDGSINIFLPVPATVGGLFYGLDFGPGGQQLTPIYDPNYTTVITVRTPTNQAPVSANSKLRLYGTYW